MLTLIGEGVENFGIGDHYFVADYSVAVLHVGFLRQRLCRG